MSGKRLGRDVAHALDSQNRLLTRAVQKAFQSRDRKGAVISQFLPLSVRSKNRSIRKLPRPASDSYREPPDRCRGGRPLPMVAARNLVAVRNPHLSGTPLAVEALVREKMS